MYKKLYHHVQKLYHHVQKLPHHVYQAGKETGVKTMCACVCGPAGWSERICPDLGCRNTTAATREAVSEKGRHVSSCSA